MAKQIIQKMYVGELTEEMKQQGWKKTTELDNQLETLRINYPYSKVHVYDDVLVYFDLTEKTSPIVEKELNDLITKLNLPLIAEQSSPSFAIRKCVVVKSKF